MSGSAPSIEVALVQLAPEFGNPSANLDRVEAMLGDAQAALDVLPELASSGYSFIDRAEVAKAIDDLGIDRDKPYPATA